MDCGCGNAMWSRTVWPCNVGCMTAVSSFGIFIPTLLISGDDGHAELFERIGIQVPVCEIHSYNMGSCLLCCGYDKLDMAAWNVCYFVAIIEN